jgi:hypothetical protein
MRAIHNGDQRRNLRKDIQLPRTWGVMMKRMMGA